MVSYPPFKLSKTIRTHSNDVKAVEFAGTNELVTASRDGTAKLNRDDGTSIVLVQGSSFLNSVAIDKANDKVFIGAHDSSIVSYDLKSGQQIFYLGHTANVSCIDTYSSQKLLASGSWDHSVRIWDSAESSFALEGHTQYVWDVKFVDAQRVISASADKTIKLWDIEGKKIIKTFTGHQDVVRSLLVLSPTTFMSSSNDGTLRIWDISTGNQLKVLEGHTSFVYHLALISPTLAASSGEDRTVKIWDYTLGECIQTIVLPSISQWWVASSSNGDIAVGSSDNTARIFTQAPERMASKEELATFDEAVKGSAIGENEIDESQISSSAVLTKPGKQEGQVVMVRNEITKQIEAHQYSGGLWAKIGEVVGQNQASGSKRETFNGKQYDYVFDVDIRDNEPPLKLPFNNSDNPYLVAESFIAENQLPPSYVEQIVQFLIQNSQAKKFDNSSRNHMESQNKTNDKTVQDSQVTSEVPQILRYNKLLSLKAFQPKPLLDALEKYAAERGENFSHYNIEALLNSLPSSASELLQVALELKSKWEDNLQQLLPVLDLLRVVTAEALTLPQQVTWANILAAMEPTLPKHSLIATRTLVNLLGRNDFDPNNATNKPMLTQAISMIEHVASTANHSKPMAVALATFALNLAIQSPPYVDFTSLMRSLHTTIIASGDSEAIYRFLLAIGLRSIVPGGEGKKYKHDWFDNVPSEKRISDLLQVVTPRLG